MEKNSWIFILENYIQNEDPDNSLMEVSKQERRGGDGGDGGGELTETLSLLF